MSFSHNKFLRPISIGDKNIQIYNDSGVLVYTINPLSIVNTQVNNNLLKISLKSQRVISLDFLNSSLSKIALALLQKQIDDLIDANTNDQNNPQSSTGPQGPIGPIGGTGPPTRNDSFSGVTYTVITHSSGTYPLVQVIDLSGEMNIPYNVRHTSTNSYIVEFTYNATGTVITGGAFGPQGATSYGETGSQGDTGPQGLIGPNGAPAIKTELNDGIGNPTNSITVAHNLGSYPIVQALYDDGGNYYNIQSSSYSIFYIDSNSYTITLDSDYQGFVLSGGGLTGPQGFQGDTGPQGYQGVTGPQGFQGETGPQGFQGDTGPQGTTGPVGNTGSQGPGSPGAMNTKLISYFNGATNSITINHIMGSYPLVQIIDNLGNLIDSSSYSIIHQTINTFRVVLNDNYRGWVITGGGLTGAQGTAGLQGQTGPQGTGPQGHQGFRGPTGVQGVTGPIGFQGVTGPQGATSGFFTLNDSFTAVSIITITHNSGIFPIVQILGTSGEMIFPSTIEHHSTQSYTVQFAAPSTGLIITGAGAGPQGPAIDNGRPLRFANGSTAISFTSSGPVSGTMTVWGDIVPALDLTYSLGTITNRFAEGFFGAGSIYIGDIKLSMGTNISTGQPSLVINDVVNNNSIELAPNTSNTFLIGSATMSMEGNFIPLTSSTYDLGTNDNHWNHLYTKDIVLLNDGKLFFENDQSLYLSSGALYINDVPFSAAGGVGQPIYSSVGVTALSFTTSTITSYSDIVPNQNNIDLGKTASRWSTLFVNEIFANGDIHLPEGSNLYIGGLKFSTRLTGTSNDLLTVQDAGYYLELTTQKYLSFERGSSVIVSNGLEEFYVDDEYYEDNNAALMIAIVDSYDIETGILGLVVERPIGLGKTASSWTINISGRQGGTSVGGGTGPQGPQGSGSSNPTLNFTFSDVDSFNVTHNSGLYPLVQIIDNLGNFFIPDSIIHTTTASFDVIFATTSSGIILVGGAAGPQGTMGDSGPQGDQGPQGDMGPMGDTGFQGFSGPQGTTGPQGFQGFEGPQGNVGPIGPTGSAPILYLLEAYANVTYTLPGGFTDDTCRYSIVNNTVNVPSGWFNTSTYSFTPQKAGYWEITASYDVYRNSESSMAIRKNGGVVAAAGSFNAVAQTVTKIVYLNGSTDYVDAMNTGGAALSRAQYDSRSWFQARWIGE